MSSSGDSDGMNTDQQREALVHWVARILERRLATDPNTRRAYNKARMALDQEAQRRAAREAAIQSAYGIA